MGPWLIPIAGIVIGVAAKLLRDSHDPNSWYGKMICN